MSEIPKGPWEARPAGASGKDVAIYQVGTRTSSGCLVKIPYRDGYDKSALVNLVVAAPEMLEALLLVGQLAREAYTHWDADRDSKVGKMLLALAGLNDRYTERADKIRAATAKAIGRS